LQQFLRPHSKTAAAAAERVLGSTVLDHRLLAVAAEAEVFAAAEVGVADGVG